VLRTDTGNFNRFLTSLGLLLLAAALLVPYFYFHDTDVLRISHHELSGLTQAGRNAIVTRQHRAADLENVVLGLAVLLAGSGIACLIFGGRRLRVAQVKEDAEIDRKARRDDVEIQRLSDTEVEEKRDEQAQEGAEEGKSDSAEAQQRPQPTPPAEPDRQSSAINIEQYRAAIARIEETVRQSLEASERFEFIPDAKLVGSGQTVQLDGLILSKSKTDDNIVLELRSVRQARALRLRIRQFTDTTLAVLTRFRAIADRPKASAWLLVVLPKEVEPMSVEERRMLEDQINSSMVGQGSGSIIHESELSTLMQRFEELFGPAD
jgi:hypothetical protein